MPTGWPIIAREDRRAVDAVLRRGVFSGANAPAVRGLQRQFARLTRTRYCLSTNSGTAALHMAVAALGIGSGDEVVCPAFTFLATPLAVLQNGAKPVFVDIDPVTYNIDPGAIEKKITRRTKAILAVHIHGLPADMHRILRIARKHGLYVIEDAAQAHGALYRGEPVGGIGDIAAFSLQSSKLVSAGEGGLLVTNSRRYAHAADAVRRFGEQVPLPGAERWDRSHPLDDIRDYVATRMGWMYRMPEMTAALAGSQLKRLPRTIAVAQRNADYLTRRLRCLPGVTPPAVPSGSTHVYHKYRLRLDAKAMGWAGPCTGLRDAFLKALRAEGVEAVLWQTRPLPAMKLFRNGNGHAGKFPQATRLLQDSLLIGSQSYPICAQPLSVIHDWADAFESVYRRLVFR